jgi:hypothetical protein
MKKLVTVSTILACSLMAHAEAMKGGLQLSRGEAILFSLILLAILTAIVLAFNAVLFFILNSIVKEPRKSVLPGYGLGMLCIVVSGIILNQSASDDNSALQLVILSGIAGSFAGYALGKKRHKLP